MKAITVWQPWASLIADGWKRVETRSWPTNHRGPVAIHAAKKPAQEGVDLIAGMAVDIRGAGRVRLRDYLWTTVYPLGCVVAIAHIVDCVRMEPGSWQPTDVERILGFYAPDRYAWILDGVEKLESPIPARGEQGFWEWEDPR